MTKIVHGLELNRDRKGEILVVGQSWGEVEEQEQRPFVGPAGGMFDEMLSYAGWRRRDVNVTNVVPETRPPYDDFKRLSDETIARGRERLDTVVRRLKPKLIITLGNEAACHFVPDWPTGGRGVVGAKGIEDRRGYFWETPYGWVLTLLHPAGALRKIVPGYELLRRDFRRARKWVRGRLPREEFPMVTTLTRRHVRSLLAARAVAFDIETRWGNVFTCGFCGDDLLPVAAKFGLGFEYMADVLNGGNGVHGRRGIAHNGPYDVDLLDREGYPTALYTDDTQAAWGNALEPELAFRDEGEDGGRLTRKGLASLATLHPDMNVPYWKAPWTREGFPEWVSGYPEEESDDPDELAKLYRMAGRDSYIARRLWDWLWPQVEKYGRQEQYRLAFETNLRCITMTRRGWRVDNALRKKRIKILDRRAREAGEASRAAALAYIEKHGIEDFRWVKQCPCCSGVGVRCWRCAGLEQMPKRKEEYAAVFEDWENFTVADLKAALPACEACHGVGWHTGYEFSPYSNHQLRKLLYEHLKAPKWVFKGKEKMDEMAQLRLLLWSEGKR